MIEMSPISVNRWKPEPEPETGVDPRLHSFNGRNRRCMQFDQ